MKTYYFYKLSFKCDSRIYIGMTKRPDVRRKQHIDQLVKRKHHNSHLQDAFNHHSLCAEQVIFCVFHEGIMTLSEAKAKEADFILRHEWSELFNMPKSLNNFYRHKKSSKAINQKPIITRQPELARPKRKRVLKKVKRISRSPMPTNTILNWGAVTEIRHNIPSRCLMSDILMLARQYDVSLGTMLNMLRNKTWYDDNYDPPEIG